jgi:RNA polymerase sigma-70 factor (sigma-E family)
MSTDEDFVEFVSTRWARLYRTARVLTLDPATAEDVLQIAMEKTYLHWHKVRRMDDPAAYVRRVMVNVAISSRQRRWRRVESPREELPERPLPAAEDGVEEHAALWPLVCALPERQRAVVVLRYYEDLTERETADVLDCSLGTVKSQAHDALRALRRGISAPQAGEVLES